MLTPVRVVLDEVHFKSLDGFRVVVKIATAFAAHTKLIATHVVAIPKDTSRVSLRAC